MGELTHVVTAFGLGQDDAVDVGDAEDFQVVLVEPRAEWIDAHPPLRAAGALE